MGTVVTAMNWGLYYNLLTIGAATYLIYAAFLMLATLVVYVLTSFSISIIPTPIQSVVISGPTSKRKQPNSRGYLRRSLRHSRTRGERATTPTAYFHLSEQAILSCM